jgi:hypothetical protein
MKLTTEWAIKIGRGNDFTFLTRVNDDNRVQTFLTRSSAEVIARLLRKDRGWPCTVVKWAA